MKRYSFWREALFAYIHEVARRPFEWGNHDCGLFAAGAVQAMTGVDMASEYRGRYTTLLGGIRLLKKAGFADHAELAASLFEEIPVARAGVGDIAAIEEDGQIALGIVQGPRIYVLRPDNAGIGTVGLLDAKRAFRVPH